jgi:hypothetical protein
MFTICVVCYLTHLFCFEEDQKQNWELISVWFIMKGLFSVTLVTLFHIYFAEYCSVKSLTLSCQSIMLDTC